MKGMAKAASEAKEAFFERGDKRAIERFCKKWLRSTEPHIVEGVWEALKGAANKPVEQTFLKGDEDTEAYLKAVAGKTKGRAARQRDSIGRIDSDSRGLKREKSENFKIAKTAKDRQIERQLQQSEKELGIHSPSLKKEMDAELTTGGRGPTPARAYTGS